MNFSPLMQDLVSAVPTSVERAFWLSKASSVESLTKQIEEALNTPLLPLQAVDKWYREFIDTHTFGSEEEKEALKEKSPYTIEMHGKVPLYRLEKNIIHLMLLDFGVVGLKKTAKFAQNYYRPNVLIKDDTIVAPAIPVVSSQWKIVRFMETCRNGHIPFFSTPHAGLQANGPVQTNANVVKV
jgi:hypothetical protein